MGVLNQQKLISRLSTGICQIADVLPRAELVLQLYPNSQIRHLISRMYAYILRFLIRSLHWYQESKLLHLVHAITRPVELRFDDLIEEIRLLSSNLTDLASASGHAEQRDMHTEQLEMISEHRGMHVEQRKSFNEQRVLKKKVDYLTKLLEDLRETIINDQAINASARIELRQDLSDIQVGHIMSLISRSDLLDPIKSLQTALFMRNRRRERDKNKGIFVLE